MTISPIFTDEQMNEALMKVRQNQIKQAITNTAWNIKKFDQPMPGTVNNLEESLSLLMAAHETIADLVKNTACILNREKSHQGATSENLKKLMQEHKVMADQLKDAGANVYESAQALVRVDMAIRESEGRL